MNSANFHEKEFVILDYNSEDGLYEWAKDELRDWEQAGIVKYLRTRTPEHFNAAHAKNIAHKNASGDVLCNLDCDNFVLSGFCEYLSSLFKDKNIVVCSGSDDLFGSHGCCGKIAVTKESFFSINGYDELSGLGDGWGWDDVNFRFRVENHNSLKKIFCDSKYNMVIPHDNDVRTSNFLNKNILKTQSLSINRLLEIRQKGDYIANKGVNWGYVEDLKIGLT